MSDWQIRKDYDGRFPEPPYETETDVARREGYEAGYRAALEDAQAETQRQAKLFVDMKVYAEFLEAKLERAREVLIVARRTIRMLGAGPLDVMAAGLRADAITQINGVLSDKGGE